MILKIAWRNIWRNKRRTAITAASIFFAVLLAVATNSMNRGIFDKMINDSVSFYSGFAQVVQKGYWDDRSLDHSFELTASLRTQLMETKGINEVVPRLESFALASFGKITKSAMVIGIDPTKEDDLTGLKKRVKQGEYLNLEDQAVLISEGLAEKLKLTISDTIVLISQGYRGVNAAGKYPIKGIVSFGSPDLNSKMIYMPLAAAQWFYGTNQMITSAVLTIDNRTIADKVLKELTHTIDTAVTYEIMGWKEMMPDLMEMKDLKESSNMITVFILYFIVSFGIFGTILMMTKERQYEFGILLSIGMKRSQLALTTWMETLLLGFLGAMLGIVISYGLMYYLSVNPIVVTGDMAETYAKFGIEAKLPASVDLDLFYMQGIIVMIITTVLALYPCLKIWRMKPIDAMRA
ncbi:ABC transporter permease [Aureispira anguillae]|uniref:FtsX-like permease family protein n=1 Tax=Aureispira anguillae TaxID=2864201 RepID=A0A915YII6_9BACT|nr:FtsX-like permease family protein [Aureispira anguillae]BDS13828.1 FtsX-like permease family protein [Aureispira anguillae]